MSWAILLIHAIFWRPKRAEAIAFPKNDLKNQLRYRIIGTRKPRLIIFFVFFIIFAKFLLRLLPNLPYVFAAILRTECNQLFLFTHRNILQQFDIFNNPIVITIVEIGWIFFYKELERCIATLIALFIF
jgi:hypothetical protein